MTDEYEKKIPLAERPLRFMDLETLGIGHHQPIVEIAILDHAGKVLVGSYVKPAPEPEAYIADADPQALQWSRYLDDRGRVTERYRNAPTLAQLAPKIIEALDGCQVWGHTIWFDVQRLRDHLKAAGVEVPKRLAVPCFGVETLAAEHLPFLTSFRLTNLAKALGFNTDGAHTARADANMARLVYHQLYQGGRLDRWLLKHRAIERGAL